MAYTHTIGLLSLSSIYRSMLWTSLVALAVVKNVLQKKLTNIAATDGCDSFGAFGAAVAASFGREFFYVFSFLLLHSLIHTRAISKIFFSFCGPTKKRPNSNVH